MPGLWCSLQLLLGFLAFSGCSAHSRHKAMVVSSRSSSAAALGSERLHLAFLRGSRQRPSYAPSISVIFMSAVEYFQAIPFKHYLLAVKKIDPLQALGFLKRGLKIAQGTTQLQLSGNWALCLHFCRFPFQPCSWKPVALPLLGTDAKRGRNGPGPSLDLGSHLASVNAKRHWGNGEWAYQTLGFEKAYSILWYIFIFGNEKKKKPIGFVM